MLDLTKKDRDLIYVELDDVYQTLDSFEQELYTTINDDNVEISLD